MPAVSQLPEVVGHLLLAVTGGERDDPRSYFCGPYRAADRLGRNLNRPGFVVLIEDNATAVDTVTVAKEMLAVLDQPFDVGDHTLVVSASIGVVERRVADTQPAELLRSADAALQASKADGNGRWSMFNRVRAARARFSSALASAIPAALADQQFRLDYQPIVELDSGAVAGVEALVRWRHPTHGLLTPERFIPIAEETGTIVDLGKWVLKESCRQAQRWRVQGVAVPMVSVNIAVRQLVDPGFFDDVVQILDVTGLDRTRLQLELTESAVMVAPGRPLDALRALADLGVRIAVDDFGTGYSNLAYLRYLPLSGLKLASSFTAGIRTDGSVDEKIVMALVSLARSLQLTVTAEGIETCQQARRLHAIGCDTGQGAYFGTATSPDALSRSTVAERR